MTFWVWTSGSGWIQAAEGAWLAMQLHALNDRSDYVYVFVVMDEAGVREQWRTRTMEAA